MLQKLKELQAKLKALMDEYGPVALGVWFAIFFSVLGGFYVAISSGMESLVAEDEALAMAETGVLRLLLNNLGLNFLLAYAATQLTKPIRIVATLAATPVVARWLRVKRGGGEGEE